MLGLENFNLSEGDLGDVFDVRDIIDIPPSSLSDIINTLKKIYCLNIGFEYSGIRDPSVINWYRKKIESDRLNEKLSIEDKSRILKKLNDAVVFENFLHTKYIGQKRFSLEGGESTIPALDEIINKASIKGCKDIIIGMAHRGRLNVLANIMKKTYEEIFTEFEGQSAPEEIMGDGDVKYHLGFNSRIKTEKGNEVYVELMPNPSHLESVYPIVIGYARARIDIVHNGDNEKVLPIVIHGDAAIAGQGIVYEMAQMSNLKANEVGGTIHFVINNQIGFTTDFQDGRSSNYCTDISQVIEVPEIHVNGDDVESVVFSVKLAVEFRQRFKKDIYIDMVCYRKYGHNESDEPRFTQPKLYDTIAKHFDPRRIYIEKLRKQGEIDSNMADKLDEEFRKSLNDTLIKVRNQKQSNFKKKNHDRWTLLSRPSFIDFHTSPSTSIKHEIIHQIGQSLIEVPKDFKVIRQTKKLLADRERMIFKTKMLNWSLAELLAYGSLLVDGKFVRLTGQDVERGTFSHRHAILVDVYTNKRYNSLNYIYSNQIKKFEIYNSLLSEYGSLGFEFGYSMSDPNALVIWEAQFGDFANGSQIIIDQFIISCSSKWGRMSGIVLLLPHGYEGQGSEHSNARPERFLQLAAENNIIVINPTTPANFFHALRRQMAWSFRSPLIVMTPKSMLRNPECISSIEEFVNDKFRETYWTCKDNSKVEKLIMCSGKIYYDLIKNKSSAQDNIGILRLEQLYPYPKNQIEKVIQGCKNLKKIIWLQEEPENMGYYSYILQMMRNKNIDIVSRKRSASSATAYSKIHNEEQRTIIEQVLG